MEASKWLQIQALVEIGEMESLLNDLEEIRIFLVGQVTKKWELSKKDFLKSYQQYVLQLKDGKIPDAALFRKLFSCVFTLEKDHLLIVSLTEEKKIVKVVKPAIQLQLHTMGYSEIEQKFRPQVFGQDTIHWGLAFSYPQLYLNPANRKVEKVFEGDYFPNTILFRRLQKWIRSQTIPTPFVVKDKKVNVPMRIGKTCLRWINVHPQLRERGIHIECGGVGLEN